MKRASINVEVEPHDLVEVRPLKGGMARVNIFSRTALSDDPAVRDRGDQIAVGLNMPQGVLQQLAIQLGKFFRGALERYRLLEHPLALA